MKFSIILLGVFCFSAIGQAVNFQQYSNATSIAAEVYDRQLWLGAQPNQIQWLEVIKDVNMVLGYIKSIPSIAMDIIDFISKVQGQFGNLIKLVNAFLPIGPNNSPPTNLLSQICKLWGNCIADLEVVIIKFKINCKDCTTTTTTPVPTTQRPTPPPTPKPTPKPTTTTTTTTTTTPKPPSPCPTPKPNPCPCPCVCPCDPCHPNCNCNCNCHNCNPCPYKAPEPPAPAPGPNNAFWWQMILKALNCIVDIMKTLGPSTSQYYLQLEADPSGRSIADSPNNPDAIMQNAALKLSAMKILLQNKCELRCNDYQCYNECEQLNGSWWDIFKKCKA